MTPLLRLALKDLWFERHLAVCRLLAMVAVLTPLLVLLGLKAGIITSLTERLLRDPLNLELVIPGNISLDDAALAALRQQSGVGFMIPRSRSLAATVDLSHNGAALTGTEMIPTAVGDPLLDNLAPPTTPQQVLISQTAAQRLKAAVGDTVTAVVSRRINNTAQAARQTLTIAGIVPETRFARDGLFVHPDLLSATEDYRDGKTEDLSTPLPGPRRYAGVRLFAKGLDEVAPLAEQLRAMGYEVRTRAAEIATVQSLDRVLTFLFAVIAGLAGLGYALSLAAGLWADVDRKRKELALLRLLGLSRASVIRFPMVQSLVLALLGSGVSLGLYFALAALFNRVLADGLARDEFVCRLLPQHMGGAVVLTLAVAVLASVLGGYHIARIDPADSLRDL